MTDPSSSGPDHAGRTDAERDAFAGRIAGPMRSPERLDDTFEARVMSAVHAEARAGVVPGSRIRRGLESWWLRPRQLRASPLGMLGAAAALVAVTLAGSHLMRAVAAGTDEVRSEAAAADTVHLVRFVFIDPDAQSVSLVGDFNAWKKGATRLAAMGAGGAWSVSIPLPAGRHEYAFIVEQASGERWVADPFAIRVHDEFDTESSVVILGSASPGAGDRGAS